MKIVYTNTARRDLREIYELIAYTLLVPNTAKRLTVSSFLLDCQPFVIISSVAERKLF